MSRRRNSRRSWPRSAWAAWGLSTIRPATKLRSSQERSWTAMPLGRVTRADPRLGRSAYGRDAHHASLPEIGARDDRRTAGARRGASWCQSRADHDVKSNSVVPSAISIITLISLRARTRCPEFRHRPQRDLWIAGRIAGRSDFGRRVPADPATAVSSSGRTPPDSFRRASFDSFRRARSESRNSDSYSRVRARGVKFDEGCSAAEPADFVDRPSREERR